MTTFKTRLNQIEARLRGLVEGGAVRLFGSRRLMDSLNENLEAAMQAGVRLQPSGEPIAPNLYTVAIHPNQLSGMQADDVFLEKLAAMLQESAVRHGLVFESPPVVRILEDSQSLPNQIAVTARISIDDLAQTSDLPAQPASDGRNLPEHAFLVVNGTQVFSLAQMVINIGRRPDNHLVIADGRVSRVHAQLRAIHGRYMIFDLDSSGGTFVNDQRVHQSLLYPGDVISLAGVPLVYGQEQYSLGQTQKLATGSKD